ncbi:TauD/TfdA family dioxygenase [Pseudomonas sp. RtIB026]|uniref:TauD/TfdA family dioxygenase n=1 Tax=Pseudomonas sp. RtIB026 TaxID=2749999 RepID=UPI001940ED58|nr:TauD/TfdA family dioxygenase [Pseudomonas sp. RtIB026]
MRTVFIEDIDKVRELLDQAKEVEWLGGDLKRGAAAQVVELTESQRADLRLIATVLSNEQVMNLTRQGLLELMPSFSEKLLRAWLQEIEYGHGWLLLRGFPLDLDNLAAIKRAYAALGRCLGMPVSQTYARNAVAEVEDLGKSAADPTSRGHQTSSALPFHCDRCDIVALLCVNNAFSGGRSQILSAPAVLRCLIDRYPDTAIRLLQPLPHDRRGEHYPHEAPWIPLEIFAFVEGRFVSRYIRRFNESAGRFGGGSQLSEQNVSDLNRVDQILAEHNRAYEMDLQPGDLQLLNNFTVWHARTRYLDDLLSQRHRLLLRLWLASPLGRALPSRYQPLYGVTASGVLRGGVPPATQGII